MNPGICKMCRKDALVRYIGNQCSDCQSIIEHIEWDEEDGVEVPGKKHRAYKSRNTLFYWCIG